jgi:hypothetical protein
MNPPPKLRVPKLHGGLIVAKVGIERTETAPAYFDGADLSNLKMEVEP